MKNEKIDFTFMVPTEALEEYYYNYDFMSQRIEYFTENNEYNGIVRISYDIEEVERISL